MSTVHSLRLKNIVIDISCFTHVEMLVEWFNLAKLSYQEKEALNREDVLKITPAGLENIPRLLPLPCEFHKNFNNTINFDDYENVVLDMIISFKNNSNDELQIFVMWLQQVGIKSGDIYYDHCNLERSLKVKYHKCMLASMSCSGDINYEFQYYNDSELTDNEIWLLDNDRKELWFEED